MLRSLTNNYFICKLIVCLIFLLAVTITAKEEKGERKILTDSLPYRTALHHDPTLRAPLEKLVTLYRAAGEQEELLRMYDLHLRQYPKDESATIVLISIMIELNHQRSIRRLEKAVADFPKSGYLHYMLYQHLDRSQLPGSIKELLKAVNNAHSTKEWGWTQELIEKASKTGETEIAREYLAKTAENVKKNPRKTLKLAGKMLDLGFADLALTHYIKAEAKLTDPELLIEAKLGRVKALLTLDRKDEAAEILEKLLTKVTNDYWRRSEILSLSLALIDTAGKREKALAKAKENMMQKPRREIAALDYGKILTAFGYREKALQSLLESGDYFQESLEIEEATLELYDILNDNSGRLEFIQKRLKEFPQRNDLQLLYVKSLFRSGNKKGAEKILKKIVASSGAENEFPLLLSLARYLRQISEPDLAAELLARCIEIKPRKLDVFREYFEILLYQQRLETIRAKLAKLSFDKVEHDDFSSLMNFLLKNGFANEAYASVKSRFEKDPEHLETGLLFLRIKQRLSLDNKESNELITKMRKLADTEARYQLWLKTTLDFHEAFESVDNFLLQERLRLENTPETDLSLSRKMRAFLRTALNIMHIENSIALLDQWSALAPFIDKREELQREKVFLFEGKKDKQEELILLLEQLSKKPSPFQNEYKCRLIIALTELERYEKAQKLLITINPTALKNPSIIQKIMNLDIQTGRVDEALELASRLTALQPSNKSYWEKYLQLLISQGSETAFRGAIRRLLSGVKDMKLSKEVRALLKKHYLASAWRSIIPLVGENNSGSRNRAVAILNDLENFVSKPEEAQWILWARAYTAYKAGNKKACKAIVSSLEKNAKISKGKITFPGGFSTTVDFAKKLFEGKFDTLQRKKNTKAITSGLPGKVKWLYCDTENANIIQTLPLSDGKRVLIVNDKGMTTCLDNATGKRIWSSGKLFHAVTGHNTQAPRMATNNNYRHYRNNYRSTSDQIRKTSLLARQQRLLLYNKRIFVPLHGKVKCIDEKDFKLLWEIPILIEKTISLNRVKLFAMDDALRVYDPDAVRLLAIDYQTGKRLWVRDFQKIESNNQYNNRDRAAQVAADGNFIFVNSSTFRGVIDLKDGTLLWNFKNDLITTLRLSNPKKNINNRRNTGRYPRRAYNRYNPYSNHRRINNQHSRANWMQQHIGENMQIDISFPWVLMSYNHQIIWTRLDFPMKATNANWSSSPHLLEVTNNKARIITANGAFYILDLPSAISISKNTLPPIMKKQASAFIDIIPIGRCALFANNKGALLLNLPDMAPIALQKWSNDLQSYIPWIRETNSYHKEDIDHFQATNIKLSAFTNIGAKMGSKSWMALTQNSIIALENGEKEHGK